MAEQNIWMQFIVDFGENTEKRDEFVRNFTDVFKDVYITLKDRVNNFFIMPILIG